MEGDPKQRSKVTAGVDIRRHAGTRPRERQMNQAQRLWWQQAQSDLQLLNQFSGSVHQCHRLHYLQMATEKLSKAYLWRSGKSPPRSHVGFVRFLKALLDRRSSDLVRISRPLGY